MAGVADLVPLPEQAAVDSEAEGTEVEDSGERQEEAGLEEGWRVCPRGPMAAEDSAPAW